MDQETNDSVISLIKELQKQITYLERKIDTLVAQSANRSSGQKSFSPSSRSYGDRPRHDQSRGSSFGHKRREEGGSSFGHKRREEGSGSSFGHKRREEGGRYVEKKRPFRPGDRDRSAKKS